MLKSLVDSAICLDTASEPVLKLRTEPAPLHWIDIQHTVLSKNLGWHCSLNTREEIICETHFHYKSPNISSSAVECNSQ